MSPIEVRWFSRSQNVFDKNVTPIKNLVEKIGDLSRLTLDQRNYFLHDISNIINRTFYTELNRKLQTYGMITTAPAGIKSTHMVTPKISLKFNVPKEEYKENVVIQLERITSENSINVKDDKVTNFSILATRQQSRVGNKRTMPYETIDHVKIGGLQNFDRYDKLNPVEISVRDSEGVGWGSNHLFI